MAGGTRTRGPSSTSPASCTTVAWQGPGFGAWRQLSGTAAHPKCRAWWAAPGHAAAAGAPWRARAGSAHRAAPPRQPAPAALGAAAAGAARWSRPGIPPAARQAPPGAAPARRPAPPRRLRSGRSCGGRSRACHAGTRCGRGLAGQTRPPQHPACEDASRRAVWEAGSSGGWMTAESRGRRGVGLGARTMAACPPARQRQCQSR